MTDKPIVLSEYTQEELQSLQHEISLEIERRVNAKQERAWRAVTDAIQAYNKEYGEIIIFDNDGRETFLDLGAWTHTHFGEISVY
jgi:antibiotic biosynthesis monooxygenase (ABM) superfamily enzyme